MRPDVEGLLALAEKATPGPWTAEGTDAFSEGSEIMAVVLGPDPLLIEVATGEMSLTESEYTPERQTETWAKANASQAIADAAYIAAADPTTVAALCRRVQELEAALRTMTGGHKAMHQRGGLIDCPICAAIAATVPVDAR